MARIIVISDCALDILFPSPAAVSWPLELSARPAGVLFNAAALLGAQGREVTFVGEAARDALGDILVAYLDNAGVDTRCIDRFSDGGVTASNFIIADASSTIINRRYPSDEKFNPTWPRIDAGDIVIFGGFFALDDRSRPQVMEILQYARERHALTLYYPDFRPAAVARITKVMPAILENLEMADVVIASDDALNSIWNTDDPQRCFEQNIRFYSPALVAVNNSATPAVDLFIRDCHVSAPIADAAGSSLAAATAAIAAFLADNGLTPQMLSGLTNACIDSLVNTVAQAINTSIRS